MYRTHILLGEMRTAGTGPSLFSPSSTFSARILLVAVFITEWSSVSQQFVDVMGKILCTLRRLLIEDNRGD
jgi:hypothetical protein